MLLERSENYYDKKNDLNCAETILYAANEEYNLGTTNWKELKEKYKKNDEKRCIDIIRAASEILDEIVKREKAV